MVDAPVSTRNEIRRPSTRASTSKWPLRPLLSTRLRADGDEETGAGAGAVAMADGTVRCSSWRTAMTPPARSTRATMAILNMALPYTREGKHRANAIAKNRWFRSDGERRLKAIVQIAASGSARLGAAGGRRLQRVVRPRMP